MKALITAVMLTLMPGLVLAQACEDRAKASCKDGTTWDAATGECLPKPSA